MEDFRPPKWAYRFFKWFCNPEYFEFIHGDLEEIFLQKLHESNPKSARRFYLKQVIKLFRPSIFMRKSTKESTSVLGLTGHYFKVAGRNLIKHKALSMLNVLGLALSMAVGMLAITLIEEQYSYDDFHVNKEKVYRLLSARKSGSHFASSPAALGRKMQEGLPDVEAVATFSAAGGKLKVKNESFETLGMVTSSDFLKVFTFPVLQGDPLLLDDPSSIFMTQNLAEKLFGSNDPLGQLVQIQDSVQLVVKGILYDVPRNSHLQFEFLISSNNQDFKTPFERSPDNWKNIYTQYNYVLFNEDHDLDRAQVFMNQASEEHYEVEDRNFFSFQPLSGIYPGPGYTNSPSQGSLDPILFKVIGGVALLLIVFSTFNYASLTTARSFTRAKEIGVRKTFGAHNKQISRQVLVESILISIVAGILAFPILKLIIPAILGLNPEIGNFFLLKPEMSTYLYFLLFAIFVGLLASIIPAFYFSRFQPVQALRDFYSVRVFSKAGLRKSLIVFQLVLGLICVSTALLTQKQFKYELEFDRGFDDDHLVNIDIGPIGLNVFRNEVEKSANIIGTTLSTNVPSSSSSANLAIKLTSGENASVNFFRADEFFFDIYALSIIGETLPASQEFDAPQITINESAVETLELGSPEEALGQSILVFGKSRRIVRVIRDFYFQGINSTQRPLIILPLFSAKSPGILSVKVADNKLRESLDLIDRAWLKSGIKTELNYSVFKEKLRQSSQHLIMTKVVGFFGVQLLLVALIGLSGICKWMAEVRAREMGIRKILGAETSQLMVSLSKGFIILTLLAVLIALPLSYMANTEIWLNSLANHVSFDWKIILASTLILGIPASLLMLFPTLAVLRRKPIHYIKEE